MTPPTRRSFSLASIAVALAGAASATEPTLPDDEAVERILADRIDGQRRSVGIAVGLISPAGRRVVGHGRLSTGDPRRPDGATVFEIASLTKVFTALLLADMVDRGWMRLDDPAARHPPSRVVLPERGRPITLEDLATHTSGLQFQPADLKPAVDAQGRAAAARYTTADMNRFLAGYRLERDVGAQWEYSNLGYALLGEALSFRSGLDFEAMVRSRICRPLAMASTSTRLSSSMQVRRAPGHDLSLAQAPDFKAPFIAPAGGLYSTADDLLNFLQAFTGARSSPLGLAMASMLEPRRPAPAVGGEQALGWVVVPSASGPLMVGVGGSLGSASAMAWDPARRTGVVVLSNSVDLVRDLGLHLLRPDMPLSRRGAAAAVVRTPIQVDAAVLDRYVGRYQSALGPLFVIAREGDSLVAQFPGARVRLQAESERVFFGEGGATVTFEVDPAGRVAGLVLRPPGGPALAARRQAD